MAQTLAKLIDYYGYEFKVTLSTLCEDLRLSRATAVRRLKWMSDNGYIIVTKDSNKEGSSYKLKKARINHFIAKMEAAQSGVIY